VKFNYIEKSKKELTRAKNGNYTTKFRIFIKLIDTINMVKVTKHNFISAGASDNL